jgi:hypothetical protein
MSLGIPVVKAFKKSNSKFELIKLPLSNSNPILMPDPTLKVICGSNQILSVQLSLLRACG